MLRLCAAGLGINEGLKVVDMRHNRITAKGLHAIASFLRTNITLLELLLSKSEQLLIAGDDLIFDDSDNSSLIDQEHRDKHRIEELLLSNKTLSKVERSSNTSSPHHTTIHATCLCLRTLLSLHSASRGRARRWI